MVGCTWSFAGAYLGIGYLNLASGLMVSIITGNGINFGIMYMARYIEARRAQESISEAILTAHRETHIATLAAAGAAMVAYGSLAVTNFRGFKHFGAIGGMGMTLCWLATYLLLPALLVLTERVRPMFGRGTSWRSKATRLLRLSIRLARPARAARHRTLRLGQRRAHDRRVGALFRRRSDGIQPAHGARWQGASSNGSRRARRSRR